MLQLNQNQSNYRQSEASTTQNG